MLLKRLIAAAITAPKVPVVIGTKKEGVQSPSPSPCQSSILSSVMTDDHFFFLVLTKCVIYIHTNYMKFAMDNLGLIVCFREREREREKLENIIYEPIRI